jgi:hypothetical protein
MKPNDCIVNSLRQRKQIVKQALSEHELLKLQLKHHTEINKNYGSMGNWK